MELGAGDYPVLYLCENTLFVGVADNIFPFLFCELIFKKQITESHSHAEMSGDKLPSSGPSLSVPFFIAGIGHHQFSCLFKVGFFSGITVAEPKQRHAVLKGTCRIAVVLMQILIFRFIPVISDLILGQHFG